MSEPVGARLVFLDTETTGLSLDDDIWEIAGITREPGEADVEFQFYVQHDLGKAALLPESFRLDHDSRYNEHIAVTRRAASELLVNVLRGAHIVGAVPNFDTERIAAMMREWAFKSTWHYHLIDVENLAVGYLAHIGNYVPLPWDSDALSRACGVEPPTKERHTALGDARWARDLYDAIVQPFPIPQDKDMQ